MNILEDIADKVSMLEVLEMYGQYPVRGRNNYRCFAHSDNHPSAGLTKSGDKFHCFSADTEIITKDGIRNIGDLVGQQVQIINGNGEWETVTIKSYGKQKLHKITLCRGGNKVGKITKEIYATDKHRWFITRQTKIGFAERTTDELQKGNILVSVTTKCNDLKFDIDGIRHGFIYGDGFKRVGGRDYIGIACFYTKPKEKLMKYFNNCRWRRHPAGQYFYHSRYKANRALNQLPTTKDTDEYILGFLAGYFSADGSFGKGTCKISCADKEQLEKVRDLCINEKFMCKKIHSRYRLGINGKYSWIHDFSVVASSLPKGFDLTERFTPKQTSMNYIHWKVLSVEETEKVEEVYCCETSTGSFALADNILTGNCFACNYTGNIFDVVQHFEKCDLKTAMRILDDKFNLGLYRELSHKEKLELARQMKERERERQEKLWWQEYEKVVLADIIKNLRMYEECEYAFRIKKGQYRGAWSNEYGDVYFYVLKQLRWLEWLYSAICGTEHEECEYDYIYPADKKEILKMIREGEIEV